MSRGAKCFSLSNLGWSIIFPNFKKGEYNLKKKKKSKLVNVTINMVDSFNSKKNNYILKLLLKVFFLFLFMENCYLFFIFYFLRKNCLLSW